MGVVAFLILFLYFFFSSKADEKEKKRFALIKANRLATDWTRRQLDISKNMNVSVGC